MKVKSNENRIVFIAENRREAYEIGRLSKMIQNTTTLMEDDVKIEFGHHEVFDMLTQIEENLY